MLAEIRNMLASTEITCILETRTPRPRKGRGARGNSQYALWAFAHFYFRDVIKRPGLRRVTMKVFEYFFGERVF